MAGPKRHRRTYTDDERAAALAALAANAGNVEKTAEQLGIPANTLGHWSRGDRHPEATQMGDEKKLPLADAFELVARKLLDVVSQKADQLDAKDAAVAAAVAVDKMRLLRGQATAVTEQRGGLQERIAGYERLFSDAARAGGLNGHAGGQPADPPRPDPPPT